MTRRAKQKESARTILLFISTSLRSFICHTYLSFHYYRFYMLSYCWLFFHSFFAFRLMLIHYSLLRSESFISIYSSLADAHVLARLKVARLLRVSHTPGLPTALFAQAHFFRIAAFSVIFFHTPFFGLACCVAAELRCSRFRFRSPGFPSLLKRRCFRYRLVYFYIASLSFILLVYAYTIYCFHYIIRYFHVYIFIALDTFFITFFSLPFIFLFALHV